MWVEDTIVRPVLIGLLSVVAPHLDLDSCMLSGVAISHAAKLCLSIGAFISIVYIYIVM